MHRCTREVNEDQDASLGDGYGVVTAFTAEDGGSGGNFAFAAQPSEPSRQPSQWRFPSALDLRVTEIDIHQSLCLWLECISFLQVATGRLVFEPLCGTELLAEASKRRSRIRFPFNATSSKSRAIDLPIEADILNLQKRKSRCKTLQEGGSEKNASRNVHL